MNIYFNLFQFFLKVSELFECRRGDPYMAVSPRSLVKIAGNETSTFVFILDFHANSCHGKSICWSIEYVRCEESLVLVLINQYNKWYRTSELITNYNKGVQHLSMCSMIRMFKLRMCSLNIRMY